MGLRSTVMFTTAPARTGKTWLRCGKFILDEYLKNYEGNHISNFPIKMDPWTDQAGREQPGLVKLAEERGISETVVRDRVITIPKEEMLKWRNDGWVPKHTFSKKEHPEPYGPWDTFADMDLAGAHIAIDECHNFCGSSHPRQIRQRWGKWLGEIGHCGATVEFLSQHPEKVAPEVVNESEIKIELTGSAYAKHPFLRIRYYYYDSMVAKLGLGWRPKVWVREKRKAAEKWKTEEDRRFFLDPVLFGAFDSHNQPTNGGRAGSLGKMEWERLAWPRFLLWFLGGCFEPLLIVAGTWGGIGAMILLAPLLAPLISLVPAYFSYMTKTKEEIARLEEESQKAVRPKINKTQAKEMAGIVSDLDEHDSERLLQLVDQVQNLQLDLDNERTKTAEAQAERDLLSAKLNAAFALATLQPDSVTFRAGYTYKIGQTIDWGPYEGRIVKEIQYDRRVVVLDNGQQLRMGVSGDSDFAKWMLAIREKASGATASAGSELSGKLPGATSGPRATTANSERLKPR